MTDQLSWSTVGELLAGFAPEGPLRTAVLLVYGLCVAVAPLIYRYYLGVLAQGAAPEGSLERQDYNKLRASLAGGNLAARLYAKWLTTFLDGIERFFGDAGMADRTLFPRAFGLKKPAPLWTAPALDRCLLLALIYPVATIFLIWAISGQVGPAETALGLDNNLPAWRRGLLAALIGVVILIGWPRKHVVAWAIVGVCAVYGVIFAAAGLAENPSASAVVSAFIILVFGLSYSLQGASGAFTFTFTFALVVTLAVLSAFSGHLPPVAVLADVLPFIGALACAVVFVVGVGNHSSQISMAMRFLFAIPPRDDPGLPRRGGLTVA